LRRVPEFPRGAVDADDLSGDAARPLTEQVRDGVGDVVRTTPPGDVQRDGVEGDVALGQPESGQWVDGRPVGGVGRGAEREAG
jgi:hypothetical protein